MERFLLWQFFYCERDWGADIFAKRQQDIDREKRTVNFTEI